MAANKYPGQCGACSQVVDAGAGTLTRTDVGTWVTYHPQCFPAPRPPVFGDHDGWHRQPLAAFDVESTGVRHSVDRIVSASLRDTSGRSMQVLLDPGVDIPAEATATHKITTADARARGRRPAAALEELAETLTGYLRSGTPVVIYNAVFDLTLLESELLRYRLRSLVDRADGLAPLIIDPLVIDRHVDRYRVGGRTLQQVCAFYGVRHAQPHQADADTRACLDLAIAIASCHPQLAGLRLTDLYASQMAWHAEHVAYLATRFPNRHFDPSWPLAAVAADPWSDSCPS
jgi:DNA polymerase-3 subunit epsilon